MSLLYGDNLAMCVAHIVCENPTKDAILKLQGIRTFLVFTKYNVVSDMLALANTILVLQQIKDTEWSTK